jgi:hypothetical protein
VLKKEISQRNAALQFNIPRQTLRDRLTGKVDPECVTTGRAPTFSLEEKEKIVPIFSLEEKEKIVQHVKTMALYDTGMDIRGMMLLI